MGIVKEHLESDWEAAVALLMKLGLLTDAGGLFPTGEKPFVKRVKEEAPEIVEKPEPAPDMVEEEFEEFETMEEQGDDVRLNQTHHTKAKI